VKRTAFLITVIHLVCSLCVSCALIGVFIFSIHISICNNGTSSLAAKDCLSFFWVWLSYSWHGTICINFGIYSLCEYFYMYGLLTKCGVKMAGYCPIYFFACLWTETKSRIHKHAKKRTRPISCHLD